MKDRSGLGWNCTIVVNREVVLEEDVKVSWGCRISDSDGHPREADRRAAGEPPDAKDVLPVRICRHAWIGNGACIMKGVTIGEGAIVGVNSVVISNIPAYSLAMGNPAEVILRNVGLPTTARKSRPAPEAEPRKSQEAE
ncbi:MAG: acyltransferase [Bryobacteraceae bacterium]|jgi:acetyltransferase-like isoleucine patch superfamily enzyme